MSVRDAYYHVTLVTARTSIHSNNNLNNTFQSQQRLKAPRAHMKTLRTHADQCENSQAVEDATQGTYSDNREFHNHGVHELTKTTDRRVSEPVLECGICLQTIRYPSDDPVEPADPKSKVKHEKREGSNTDEQCRFPVEIKVCGHVFGWDCLYNWTDMRQGNTCPICKTELSSLTYLTGLALPSPAWTGSNGFFTPTTHSAS